MILETFPETFPIFGNVSENFNSWNSKIKKNVKG